MTPHAVFVSGCPGDTRRYRALHQAEALELAGWSTAVHAVEVPSAMAAPRDVEGARALILHRVAWSPMVARLVAAARAAGAIVLFDADDLVFDPTFDARRKALGVALDAAEDAATAGRRPGLDDPAARYARTLKACDGALATTEALAAAFEAAGVRAAVVRNAIDLTMLRLSTEALARGGSRQGDRVVVGYASGTPSHDRDLAVAAPALRALLDARPNAVLRLIGPLGLDEDAWQPYADRIERVPFMHWPLLPSALAALDVNLAPLEVGDPFCEAKSELKLVEAGAVAVPTVASPTDAFARAIDDGVNGLLAASTEGWLAALTRLVDDPDRRAAVGAAARATVLERYTTDVRGAELADAIERLGAVDGGAHRRATVPATPASSRAPLEMARDAFSEDATGRPTLTVLEDVPGLDRFAMGADYVAAEDAARSLPMVAARGPWLAAVLASERRADGSAIAGAPVRAVPYPVETRLWHSGVPPRLRPARALFDIAPEPPVDASTVALGLDALALAAGSVKGLHVDLYASRPGAAPPDDPRLADFGWLGVLDAAGRAGHHRTAAAVLVPTCGNVRLATVEAMAAGCAVVACDVPAVRWLLVDGATAALAPPQADALAAVLGLVLQDAALRERIVLGALAVVERQTVGRAATVQIAAFSPIPESNRWLDRLQPLGEAHGPPMTPGTVVGQTFTARMNGLCRIDVQLTEPLPEGAELHLTLHARDGEPKRMASALAGAHLPGAWLALEFAPIADSAGRRFLAQLTVTGGAPGETPPTLRMANAAVFAAGRTYVGGAADDGAALVMRTFCRQLPPPPVVADRDPRQPALDALRHLALEAGEVAASEPYHLAAWFGRWWAPLPPIQDRPWPPDAPARTKLWRTLRHYGPAAVVREAMGALRWRRMDADEREAALRGG